MKAAGGTNGRKRGAKARVRVVVEAEPATAGQAIAKRLKTSVAEPSVLPQLTTLQRVLDRTDAAVDAQLTEAASARHGLVAEVDRLRTAARAVVTAEEAVATARAELDALGPLPNIVTSDDDGEVETLEAEADSDADEAVGRGGRWWTVWLAALITVGATVGLLIGDAPWLAALVFLGGAFITAQLVGRARRRDDDADRMRARSVLEHAATQAERTEHPVPEVAMALARQRRQVWEQRRADRSAAVERAERELADRLHAWSLVAGPGADPGAIDELVRRRYPALDTDAVRHRHPASRAVRKAMAAVAGGGKAIVLVEPFGAVGDAERVPLRVALDTVAKEQSVVVVVADEALVPGA